MMITSQNLVMRAAAQRLKSNSCKTKYFGIRSKDVEVHDSFGSFQTSLDSAVVSKCLLPMHTLMQIADDDARQSHRLPMRHYLTSVLLLE